MRLTNKLIDLMCTQDTGPVIVGPLGGKYAYTQIGAKIAHYNEGHGTNVRVKQHVVFVIDPETLKTTRMFQMEIIK